MNAFRSRLADLILLQPGPHDFRIYNYCDIPKYNGQRIFFCRNGRQRRKKSQNIPHLPANLPWLKKRNIMLEKFKAYVELSLGQYASIPKPFFFYGSLIDPLRLQEVLQLPAPLVLKSARVKSYKIILRGQYPTLVDGPIDSYVDGMAYVVETEQ
jgi:hypothetical protein